MSENIRGAIFNALGDIADFVVLDAFAGSGALGIEALSRGAQKAFFIDSDKRAASTIKSNVQKLGLESQAKIIQANISSWSDIYTEQLFDLVLADPPYDDIKPDVLAKIAGHAGEGAVIVFSLPPDHVVELPKDQFEPLAYKHYGDASLVFYRKV